MLVRIIGLRFIVFSLPWSGNTLGGAIANPAPCELQQQKCVCVCVCVCVCACSV